MGEWKRYPPRRRRCACIISGELPEKVSLHVSEIHNWGHTPMWWFQVRVCSLGIENPNLSFKVTATSQSKIKASELLWRENGSPFHTKWPCLTVVQQLVYFNTLGFHLHLAPAFQTFWQDEAKCESCSLLHSGMLFSRLHHFVPVRVEE